MRRIVTWYAGNDRCVSCSNNSGGNVDDHAVACRVVDELFEAFIFVFTERTNNKVLRRCFGCWNSYGHNWRKHIEHDRLFEVEPMNKMRQERS
ncbi:hypothetical protein D9M68_862870 [compost metagenome]